ncbi:MAG: outer membrane protein assembly factor BamD [Sphingosinicella sp.]|uniref:outer membrane protein assembly factor BamD n=1 Tax=Sphingosinicella sp. TaxID=1917971 RepID=UPI004037E63E
MHSFSRPLALLAAVAIVPLAGCGTLGLNRTAADTRYVARDVNTLYNAAFQRLQRRQYQQAALIFDEVERQHPYSIWARRAQLMSAFSYYAADDHTKSIESARRFLSIHPGNRDAPYALYLIALNYYEQISDVSRDQGITRQALDALGEVVRRYPGTPYADDARLKIDLVRDHLAGKEMEVGRFYQRRAEWLASTVRFRNVIEQYQTTSHTPEALMRLTESYLALGIPGEARRSAAVLSANYPNTEWYERAYNLIQRHAPNTTPDTPLGSAPTPPPAAATPEPQPEQQPATPQG